MGKKSDLKNIFESYYNDVVLGEAVKPEEVDSTTRQLTPEQQAAVQNIMNTKGYDKARAEMMVLRGQDVKNAAAAQQPAQPTQPTTQPITKKPEGGIALNGITIGSPTQSKLGGRIGSLLSKTLGRVGQASSQPTQPVANVVKQAAQQASQEGTEETAQQTNQEVIGSRPDYTAGTQNFNGTKVTSGPVVDSDEEFEQDENEDTDSESDDEGEVESKKKIGSYPVGAAGKFEFDGTTITAGPVVEKNNISKFLKHLSEKNYSSAHKYLKAILNSKINNIVSERIDKNFK